VPPFRSSSSFPVFFCFSFSGGSDDALLSRPFCEVEAFGYLPSFSYFLGVGDPFSITPQRKSFPPLKIFYVRWGSLSERSTICAFFTTAHRPLPCGLEGKYTFSCLDRKFYFSQGVPKIRRDGCYKTARLCSRHFFAHRPHNFCIPFQTFPTFFKFITMRPPGQTSVSTFPVFLPHPPRLPFALRLSLPGPCTQTSVKP